VVRRPLQPEELDALVTAAMAEPSANDGLALALRMLLDSSSFLFRVEIGDPAPDHPSWRRVSSAEMATKLAYTLWATTPTPELLAQGEAGALGAPAAIQKTARTMLADERARPVLRRFLQEWLDLTRLPTVTFDTKVLPGWSEGLRSSMLEETTRFLEDLAWSRDGGFGRMLTSPTTFLDANVARSYGMAAPASAWARTDLTHAPSPRAGIMTQPAVLALTGRSNGASAIWRGKYVRERLLCETLARPPANVPQLAAAAPSASERERLAAHRSDPSCAGCHRLLEPVGFGLARYDAAGAYHATDASGKAIDESGKIEGFDAPEFSGAVALATKLSSAAEASSCPTQMLASSLLGRSPTDDDEALMGWLAAAYADAGESLPDAIAAFVGNVAFTHFVP
jgi:hypothetical protein